MFNGNYPLPQRTPDGFTLLLVEHRPFSAIGDNLYFAEIYAEHYSVCLFVAACPELLHCASDPSPVLTSSHPAVKLPRAAGLSGRHTTGRVIGGMPGTLSEVS